MNWKTAGVVSVVACLLAMTGGCAKNQTLKKDDAIAPAVAATAPAHAAQPVQAKAAPSPQTEAVQQQAAAQSQPTAPVQSVAVLKQGLNRIYFGFDSSTLSDQARTTLVANAEFLKKPGSGKIRVEGHCDERGSDDYNLALGEKRAKEAVKYLTSLGIPAERLTVISYGKEKPLVQGHDEASWAKNRCDDFVVVP